MKKYLVLFLASLLSQCLYAQDGKILYKEYEPVLHTHFVVNSPTSGWPYDLKIDLDQDGVDDWKFQKGGSYHYLEGIWLSFMPISSSSLYQTAVLELGDTISTYPWNPDNLPMVQLFSDGLYRLGIKWEREGNLYYGWIEVSLECGENYNNSSYPETIDLYLHRTAYCNQADYPLRVGQTNFNWISNEYDAFSTIHPNPTLGMVTVSGGDLQGVEVYDPLGQLVMRQLPKNDNVTFDLTGQPAGIYLIRITSQEGKRCVKKVVKQ